MNTPLYLGVDIGTSVAKGTIIDCNGSVITDCSYNRKHIEHSQKAYEHHPEKDWWNEFKYIIKHMVNFLGQKKKNIKCLAISGMIPNICPLDRNDKILHNAILYYDTRAHEIENKLDEELMTPKWQNQALSFLLMLKERLNDKWFDVNKVFTTHNYIVYKLTGRYILDSITALEFGNLFNKKSFTWDNDILSKYNLNSFLLPEISLPTTIVGRINKKSSFELDLPTDIIVANGTTDTISSLLGSGLRKKNDFLIYYGTYNCIPMLTVDILDVLYKPKIKYPIDWLVSIPRGGQQICSLASMFFPNKNLNYSLKSLDEKASLSGPGSNGIIFLQTPELMNSSESTEPKGTFFQIGMDNKIEDICRSILEAFGYGIRLFLEQSNKKIDRYNCFAGGGGAKSIIWKQIVSDITGFKQLYLPNTFSAYGSAIIAAAAADKDILKKIDQNQKERLKIILPNHTNREKYNNAYRTYKKLVKDHIT